ncbi:hypothetical protein F5887DRAFT_956388 [Amanita rubescens]|nr:hypothetical protein F5887DRAFT_956388 [Amanita rubescens]
MTFSISIQDFPEELLEHVIALCAFNRIGTPLLYHSINLTNPTQAELLLRTLRGNRDISPLIRCLVLSTITIHSAQALSLCRNLVLLDFTLDAGSSSQPSSPGPQEPTPDPDVAELSNAFSNLSQLRHLVVRKSGAGVYLTTPRVKHILCHLAESVPQWNELRPTPSGTPSDDSPVRLGPIARITHALSTRPKLHSFAAHLPSTWSNAILRVSTNKQLERIVLSDGRTDISIIPEIAGAAFSAPATEHHQQHGVLGSGLFMMEARKHAKLIELIRAGTPFIRSRTRSMEGTALQNLSVCIGPVPLISTRSTGSLAPASTSASAPSSPSLTTPRLPRRRISSASSLIAIPSRSQSIPRAR